MPRTETNRPDPEIVALAALGWILAEPGRASRLLALTGLDPQGLRARAGDPTLLAATLSFLEANEPDLIACAEAIGQRPADLVGARAELER